MRRSSTSEYLRWAPEDNLLIEVRHEVNGIWTSGWFNDPEALLREARQLADRGNVYISINAPNSRPVANAMGGAPVRNDDIAYITRLLFDLDPARPTGLPATRQEVQLAYERRNQLVTFFSKLGWSQPLLAFSGNGYHVLYRCRLLNDEATAEMLRHIYAGLYRQCNDELVHFDRSVRNPGRIIRLYGSTNRKGPSTAERPHRQAVCRIPQQWRQVKGEQIEQLSRYYERQQQQQTKVHTRPSSGLVAMGQGDYATLDIVGWFTAHGLYLGHIENGTHAVRCPWQAEHTSTARYGGTVIFEANGAWPGLHCKHSHCAERGIRDVMQLLGDADQYCAATFQKGASNA